MVQVACETDTESHALTCTCGRQWGMKRESLSLSNETSEQVLVAYVLHKMLPEALHEIQVHLKIVIRPGSVKPEDEHAKHRVPIEKIRRQHLD